MPVKRGIFNFLFTFFRASKGFLTYIFDGTQLCVCAVVVHCATEFWMRQGSLLKIRNIVTRSYDRSTF